MLGPPAIGERMDELVIKGNAQDPLIFTRGPHARREHLDPDAVTVWMDDDAAWNGQVLSESDLRRLIEWLTDGM